jgi:glutathione S-transferase
MKLYYSPNACSLSPHIVLCELGMAVSLDKVDMAAKTTSDGRDFRTVNPKGQVPTLELDDGTILTEGVAIVQYLADQKPEAGLLPPAGSIGRTRVQEALNFISSEHHKAFSPLFNPTTTPEGREAATANVRSKLSILEVQLSDGRAWLAGETFSPADTYGFVVTRWAPMLGITLDPWPSIARWMEKVSARPSVTAALDEEDPHSKSKRNRNYGASLVDTPNSP